MALPPTAPPLQNSGSATTILKTIFTTLVKNQPGFSEQRRKNQGGDSLAPFLPKRRVAGGPGAGKQGTLSRTEKESAWLTLMMALCTCHLLQGPQQSWKGGSLTISI